MGRIKLDTISNFAEQGYAVRVTCACGNVFDWNAVLLMAERHRRRRSLAIDAVERSLRCSSCEEREARSRHC
jgi:hypothetical protein